MRVRLRKVQMHQQGSSDYAVVHLEKSTPMRDFRQFRCTNADVQGRDYKKFRYTKCSSSGTYKGKYLGSSGAFPKAVQLLTKR
jgi:hypothetical protein